MTRWATDIRELELIDILLEGEALGLALVHQTHLYCCRGPEGIPAGAVLPHLMNRHWSTYEDSFQDSCRPKGFLGEESILMTYWLVSRDEARSLTGRYSLFQARLYDRSNYGISSGKIKRMTISDPYVKSWLVQRCRMSINRKQHPDLVK